jgi:hypothetical protein
MAGVHHEVPLRRWHITALEAFSTGQVAECGAKCASSELAIGSLIPQSSAEWRSSLGLIRFSESIAPFYGGKLLTLMTAGFLHHETTENTHGGHEGAQNAAHVFMQVRPRRTDSFDQNIRMRLFILL